jgi:hypothetical protein
MEGVGRFPKEIKATSRREMDAGQTTGIHYRYFESLLPIYSF